MEQLEPIAPTIRIPRRGLIRAQVVEVTAEDRLLTVVDPVDNLVYVLRVPRDRNLAMNGRGAFPLREVPIGADIRARFVRQGDTLVATRVEVYPGGLPSVGPPGRTQFPQPITPA